MPITLPSLDDRTYQQLRDDALARIPIHNPEWTNFTPSDPGVTLVELFAFMTETLLYRCNQIPERNRQKFLSLLGVPLQPGSSAVGIVTFTNDRGPLQTLTLPAGVEVTAGKIPFRTQQGLDVLPIEAKIYFKREHPASDTTMVNYYNQLYASFRSGQQPPADLALYETVPIESVPAGVDLGADTVDHSLWIALLVRANDKPADNTDAAWSAMRMETRQQIGGRVVSLGMVPFSDDATRQLEPGGPLNPLGNPLLQFEIPKVQPGTDPDQGVLGSNRVPSYAALASTASTDILADPGVLQITLPPKEELILWSDLEPLEDGTDQFPPALSDTSLSQRLITWIRVRATSSATAKILWMGINSSFVQQKAHVSNESLPDGTGEPDQAVVLAKTPVLPESVQLTVITSDGQSSEWTQIEDLMSAGPEVPLPDPRQPPGTPLPPATDPNVFTLDAESGKIQFGDGARGRRPPLGATLRADYDYGVASAGNLGKNSINSGTGLPAGVKVTNPVQTWGGVDPETVGEGEKQISRYLQHRDRLVSALDFETITLRTPGVDIGRVDVLPAYSPELAGNEPGDAPGAVTLMVIPQNDPNQPDAPVPDSLFLQAICDYLDTRRLVTTEVFLRGPDYHPIWVSVGINVVAGNSIADVNAAVKGALLQFLSPLPPDGKEQLDSQAALLTTPQDAQVQKGWPLRKGVVDRELIAVVNRVAGVLSVNDVLLAEQTGSAVTTIDMSGLELPRVIGLSVVSGDPVSVDDLRGQPSAPAPSAAKSVPVPVIPSEC